MQHRNSFKRLLLLLDSTPMQICGTVLCKENEGAKDYRTEWLLLVMKAGLENVTSFLTGSRVARLKHQRTDWAPLSGEVPTSGWSNLSE